jgi:predicted small lipoprotein YifL
MCVLPGLGRPPSKTVMKISLPCLLLPAVLGLAGCGQPGPLYLPGHPPPGLKVSPENEEPRSPIPERDIDETPAPVDAAPPKPAKPEAKENDSPTENHPE